MIGTVRNVGYKFVRPTRAGLGVPTGALPDDADDTDDDDRLSRGATAARCTPAWPEPPRRVIRAPAERDRRRSAERESRSSIIEAGRPRVGSTACRRPLPS